MRSALPQREAELPAAAPGAVSLRRGLDAPARPTQPCAGGILHHFGRDGAGARGTAPRRRPYPPESRQAVLALARTPARAPPPAPAGAPARLRRAGPRARRGSRSSRERGAPLRVAGRTTSAVISRARRRPRRRAGHATPAGYWRSPQGSPSSPTLRAEPWSRGSCDHFGRVRVHADRSAETSAALLQARAYPVGPHMCVRTRRLRPCHGRRQEPGVAHELARRRPTESRRRVLRRGRAAQNARLRRSPTEPWPVGASLPTEGLRCGLRQPATAPAEGSSTWRL